jgi:hypothetical protein
VDRQRSVDQRFILERSGGGGLSNMKSGGLFVILD